MRAPASSRAIASAARAGRPSQMPIAAAATHQPAGDGERELVGVLVGDDDADRAERGRDAGHEQDRDPQQVAEQHLQAPQERRGTPPARATTRSARALDLRRRPRREATPTQTACSSSPASRELAQGGERVEVGAVVAAEQRAALAAASRDQPADRDPLVDGRRPAAPRAPCGRSAAPGPAPPRAPASSRARCAAVCSSAAPRQWIAWIGPLSSSRRPTRSQVAPSRGARRTRPPRGRGGRAAGSSRGSVLARAAAARARGCRRR